MTRTRGPRRRASRALPLLLSLALPLGCGPAGEAHGQGDEEQAGHAGHEEGEEHGDEHAEASDPHHLAEGRADCEEDVTLPADAVARYGIRVETVSRRVLAPTISAPGHLAFPQGAVARVGSAVPGRVAELRVRTGDLVAAGDTLLVVESPLLGEAQSDYLQKRTIAATAGPTLELTRSLHERAKQLYESVQGVPLNDVQQREAELRNAERDREVARAIEAAAFNRLLLLGMNEAAIRDLERTGKVQPHINLTAPLGGRVVDVSATLGEQVDPESGPLAVVGDLSVLWAIAEVGETRLSEVALGARATVKVPALRHAACEGLVAAVAPVLEASTRTAEVRVELPNPDGSMLPGMFIQVEIESSAGGGEPRLAVPDGAVLVVEGRPSVFVPLAEGSTSFCRHDIEAGEPVGAWIPVTAGLAPGDQVVVAGAFLLKAELGKASAKHEH